MMFGLVKRGCEYDKLVKRFLMKNILFSNERIRFYKTRSNIKLNKQSGMRRYQMHAYLVSVTENV